MFLVRAVRPVVDKEVLKMVNLHAAMVQLLRLNANCLVQHRPFVTEILILLSQFVDSLLQVAQLLQRSLRERMRAVKVVTSH